MSFDAEAATRAVDALGRRHRVQVHWHAPDGPEAHTGTRQVWVNPIEELYDYLAALHELGHVIDPDARRLGAKGNLLGCEACAWEFARLHTDPTLVARWGKRTRKRIRDAWATYLPEAVD